MPAEPPRSPNARRAVRHISHPVPQRSAGDDPLASVTSVINDPLSGDVENAPTTMDPTSTATSTASPPQRSLAATTVSPTTEPSLAVRQTRLAANPSSSQHITPNPSAASIPSIAIDLRFLQDRDLYHRLTTEDLHPAFLSSQNRPPQDATLIDLLSGGHFRRAAEVSVRAILQSPPDAASSILDLFYTRLACLVLISRPDFALQEALPLLEVLSLHTPQAETLTAVTPWHLRILLARLQTIGAADGGRRGIMGLYALAAEARAALRDSRAGDEVDSPAKALWTERLQDLGLRVCDALVEMGELETAGRHLDAFADLYSVDELAYRRALLRVRVGDVSGAEKSVAKLTPGPRKDSLQALLHVAEGDFVSAESTWQKLSSAYPDHELYVQNAAVVRLYMGQMVSTRDALEELAQKAPFFPALLFNLSTVYELCTERAIEKKTQLVEQAAKKDPSPASGGWEHANFEFKL